MTRWCALLLSAWLGVIIFASAIAAPAIFAQLGDGAGAVIAILMPLYFRFGLVVGGAALVAALLVYLTGDGMSVWGRPKRHGWCLFWCALAVALTAVNLLVLLPLTAGSAVDSALGGFHGTSMLANVATALAVVAGILTSQPTAAGRHRWGARP